MALEKWTVLYKCEDGGGQPPAFWKAGAVVVAGKNKSQGFTAGTGLIMGEPLRAGFVTIEAESAEEAIKAVANFYGQGISNSNFLACKSASLTELAPLP